MKILLVEDDRDLCNTVKLQLERAGYETDVCYQGQDALFYANQYPYDVIVLDRMLPQVDGLTILQGLRRKQIATPVIITTALDGVNDRIDGLDAGADDYLPKPFHPGEFTARVRALTRRGTEYTPDLLSAGNITLDRTTFELRRGPSSIRLGSKEFQMLELLMCHIGCPISTERFMERIWGYDSEVEVSVVWVYISYLRKKLTALQADVEIRASRNLGYSLEVRT